MPKFFIEEVYLYEVEADNEANALTVFEEFMETGENENEFAVKFLDNQTEIKQAN